MCNLNRILRKYVNDYIIPLLPKKKKKKFPPWLEPFFLFSFFNTESLDFNFLLNNLLLFS